MKKKNKLKLFINSLFIVGVCLVSFPIFKNTITLLKIQRTTVEIATNLPSVELNSENETITFPTLENYLTASTETIGKAIGELSIPSSKINTPIFSGLSNEQMLFGVGTMYPSRPVKNNNMVLLGHHLGVKDVLLGNLFKTDIGDEVFVTYLNERLTYQVIEKKIVSETAIEVLENTGTSVLTLITCDVPNITDKRLVVVAKLLEDSVGQSKRIAQKSWNKKTMQRSYMEYSILPLIFISFVLLLGSYVIWKYV